MSLSEQIIQRRLCVLQPLPLNFDYDDVLVYRPGITYFTDRGCCLVSLMAALCWNQSPAAWAFVPPHVVSPGGYSGCLWVLLSDVASRKQSFQQPFQSCVCVCVSPLCSKEVEDASDKLNWEAWPILIDFASGCGKRWFRGSCVAAAVYQIKPSLCWFLPEPNGCNVLCAHFLPKGWLPWNFTWVIGAFKITDAEWVSEMIQKGIYEFNIFS